MLPDTGVPLRAITLDLDDTLWPVRPTLVHAERVLTEWLATRAPATAAWLTPDNRRAVRTALLAAHPERAHDVSFVRLESLRRALTAAGDDAELAEEAFSVFLAARQQVQLYADVEPVLARWSQRYRLVAVSNGNADVHRVGLGQYFSASVSAHQLGIAKPDPRIFLEACRVAQVLPAEVLHVGDDFHLDIRAARATGLRAAWITRPDLDHSGTPDVPDDERRFEDLAGLDACLHR